MWIHTQFGFFSITRSQVEPSKFQIRARLRADLEGLLDAVAADTQRVGRGNTPEDRAAAAERKKQIIVTPDRDYRYRVIVTPDVLCYFFGVLVDNLNYSNFKGKIAATPSQAAKLPDLHTIWHMTSGWQDREVRAHIPVRPGSAADRLLGGQHKASGLYPSHGIKAPAAGSKRPRLARSPQRECDVCGEHTHLAAHCPTLRRETGGTY